MTRLDDLIIDRVFQPIADWVTDHFDRTPFWLAAHLVVAGAG